MGEKKDAGRTCPPKLSSTAEAIAKAVAKVEDTRKTGVGVGENGRMGEKKDARRKTHLSTEASAKVEDARKKSYLLGSPPACPPKLQRRRRRACHATAWGRGWVKKDAGHTTQDETI